LVERTWRSDILDSTEDFTLHEVGSGFRLAGSMRILRGDHHVALTYLVETIGDWHTRAARVEIPALGADLDIRTGDSKSWWVDGEQVPELKGCIDIDLGWTPATNTLPLRRAEESGETSFVTRAAWLRWPELTFAPVDQTYTKRGDTTWNYRQGSFTADLDLDAEMVVITYGQPPVWHEALGRAESTL
jgi:hypothetical protein